MVSLAAVQEGISSYSDNFMYPNRNTIAKDTEPSVMFTEILQIGPPHFDIEPRRRLTGARGTVVQGSGMRIEDHLPSRCAESMAPIDILTVHEELLIESSDHLKGLPGDHPEPPRQDLDIINGSIRISIHREAAKRGKIECNPNAQQRVFQTVGNRITEAPTRPSGLSIFGPKTPISG